jgi:hypothetical protein
MTELRALNRDVAKQQPGSVFESPLDIFNEILPTKGKSSPRLTGGAGAFLASLMRPIKEWQRGPTRASSSRS